MNSKNYIKMRDNCPLCYSTDLEIVFRQKFEPLTKVTLFNLYDIARCRSCDMVFANNIPSQKDVDKYYFENNKYEMITTYLTLPIHEKTCEMIKNRYSTDKNVVDFGCGEGNILRLLQSAGYRNLFGVDTSKRNCDMLNKMKIYSINKSIFDINENDFDRKFDVILCIAVLEHIVDLHGALSRMVSRLKKEGELIICVPYIFPRRALVYPLQEFSTEHINYFTFSTLSNLCEKYGLYPIYLQQIDGAIISVFGVRNDFSLYISQSIYTIEVALSNIDLLIKLQKPVIVYGAGTLTRYLIANTRFSKLNILAFVDNDKHLQGERLASKTIIAPNELYKYPNEIILLCTYNADTVIERMIRDELNLNNEVIRFL